MSDPIPPPKSAARTWLRILAWIIPGIAAPALLLGWFILVYGHTNREIPVTILGIVLFIFIVLGCGFFNAILRRPDPSTLPANQVKSIALSIVFFMLFQVLLVPAIGYTVAFGCTTVMRNR